MVEPTYPPLYLRGIERFNRQEYFESHEVWEELWIGEEGAARSFYKGLIQAAVALYHLENGNAHGARKLLLGCTGYLAPYRRKYQGLDVDRFLAEMRRCLAAVLDGESRVAPQWDPALAPRIRLDPAPQEAAEVKQP
jgi:predicted metal-dependent hydrolase